MLNYPEELTLTLPASLLGQLLARRDLLALLWLTWFEFQFPLSLSRLLPSVLAVQMHNQHIAVESGFLILGQKLLLFGKWGFVLLVGRHQTLVSMVIQIYVVALPLRLTPVP